jgi:hypothetical protein
MSARSNKSRIPTYSETLRMIEDIATTLGNQNKLTHKGPIYHVKVYSDLDTWSIVAWKPYLLTCGKSWRF